MKGGGVGEYQNSDTLWLESNNFGQQFITYLNFDILMRFSSNSLFPCFVWKNSQQILSARKVNKFDLLTVQVIFRTLTSV